MRRFLIVCGVMLALLLVAAAVAGGDTSTNAYVVSCTDPGEIVFEGTAAQADAWVASQQYPNTGCWQTAYEDPSLSGLPLAPGATIPTTTTTTTVPPTTTTVPPTTTTTTTTVPPTTTTTLPVKKRTWVKWCARHPTYIGKRCPTHKVPAP